MTNKEIMQIALQQQAYDMNCKPEDFSAAENVIVISKPNEKARKYLNLPFFCNLCTYGNNVVASVDERVVELVRKYLDSEKKSNGTNFESFLTPRIHLLTEEFAKYEKLTCFMAEYFLPDVEILKPLSCSYEIKLLMPTDFTDLYTAQWRNALCKYRKHLDVLAIAAFDNGKMIGLAGLSSDGDDMWQIGVDVLTEYRRQGIASALTSRLAIEIIARGKIPFYCCAWSNIRSVRNAIKSGFHPAWVEFTAIDKEKAAEYMR